jgi:hypothetical protein
MVYFALNAVKPGTPGAFAESLHFPFFFAVTFAFFTVQRFLVVVFHVIFAPCVVLLASLAFFPFFNFFGGVFADWLPSTAAAGLTETGAEGELTPRRFVAVTLTWYSVPFVKPGIVQVVVADWQDAPPGKAVAV